MNFERLRIYSPAMELLLAGGGRRYTAGTEMATHPGRMIRSGLVGWAWAHWPPLQIAIDVMCLIFLFFSFVLAESMQHKKASCIAGV